MGERLNVTPNICMCGCVVEIHVANGCMGKQGPRREPCECKGFKPMEPPEVDPFATAEHYRADRKGTWTGD